MPSRVKTWFEKTKTFIVITPNSLTPRRPADALEADRPLEGKVFRGQAPVRRDLVHLCIGENRPVLPHIFRKPLRLSYLGLGRRMRHAGHDPLCFARST